MERIVSSMSGGVVANEDTSEGEEGNSENSGSKFRNSVQSELNVGSVGGNRSSCGISNKEGKSSVGVETLGRGSSLFDVSEITIGRFCTNSPGMEGTVGEGRDRGLKKSRSNEGDSGGPVEAGFGSWKDWSKSNHRGTAVVGSGSDTACKRPPSIPLGRLG